MKLAPILFGLITISAHAEERIYQTDSIGNIQYNKPSQTIRNDGRIIQTDPGTIGNALIHLGTLSVWVTVLTLSLKVILVLVLAVALGLLYFWRK